MNHLGPDQADDKLFENTESVERSEVESPEQCQGQIMTI